MLPCVAPPLAVTEWWWVVGAGRLYYIGITEHELTLGQDSTERWNFVPDYPGFPWGRDWLNLVQYRRKTTHHSTASTSVQLLLAMYQLSVLHAVTEAICLRGGGSLWEDSLRVTDFPSDSTSAHHRTSHNWVWASVPGTWFTLMVTPTGEVRLSCRVMRWNCTPLRWWWFTA